MSSTRGRFLFLCGKLKNCIRETQIMFWKKQNTLLHTGNKPCSTHTSTSSSSWHRLSFFILHVSLSFCYFNPNCDLFLILTKYFCSKTQVQQVTNEQASFLLFPQHQHALFWAFVWCVFVQFELVLQEKRLPHLRDHPASLSSHRWDYLESFLFPKRPNIPPNISHFGDFTLLIWCNKCYHEEKEGQCCCLVGWRRAMTPAELQPTREKKKTSHQFVKLDHDCTKQIIFFFFFSSFWYNPTSSREDSDSLFLPAAALKRTRELLKLSSLFSE